MKRSLFFSWIGEPDPKLAPPDPTDEEGSDISPTSISSQDPVLQANLREYMVNFLNRTLPTSHPDPSLLGTVVLANSGDQKYTEWTLIEDDSIKPSRIEFASFEGLKYGLDLAAIKANYFVGGAELVSPVLDFEAAYRWLPIFQQIYGDLEFDRHHGVWLNGQPGLHVHFAMKEGEMGLWTVQNFMVIYGLFEREIETWVGVERRNLEGKQNFYARSIREGIEKGFQGREGEKPHPGGKVARRYTPREFVREVYKANSLTELGADIYGVYTIAEYGDRPDENEDMIDEGKYTSVYISPTYGRKTKVTLEFRQHHATCDPDEIKWWITFLGYLMRYAHLHTLTGFRIEDDENDNTYSFVENITKSSILDMIAFPEEGKAHFKRMAMKHDSEMANEWRRIEELVIEQRILRRKAGQQTGRTMDMEIKKERWYQIENAQFKDKFGRRIAYEEKTDEDPYENWLKKRRS